MNIDIEAAHAEALDIEATRRIAAAERDDADVVEADDVDVVEALTPEQAAQLEKLAADLEARDTDEARYFTEREEEAAAQAAAEAAVALGDESADAAEAAAAEDAIARDLDEDRYLADRAERALAEEERAIREFVETIEDEPHREEREREEAAQEGHTSWWPIPLGPYFTGDIEDPPPAYLPRSDGKFLVYPGRTHYFIGEPESGKTWAALAATAHVLSTGGAVLYIDYEDAPSGLVKRLKLMGLTEDAADRLLYIQPRTAQNDFTDVESGRTPLQDFAEVMKTHRPALVVLDGVSEAMSLEGLELEKNSDVAKFHAKMPRLWDKSGAAVILIDHVVKGKGNIRFALGAQHKLAGVNGAVYRFDIKTPFGRGRTGKAKVTVTKDRHGYVREYAAGGEDVGTLAVGPVTDGPLQGEVELDVIIQAPSLLDLGPDEDLESRVFRYIVDHPGCSPTAIRDNVAGRYDEIARALERLVGSGRVTVGGTEKRKKYTATVIDIGDVDSDIPPS